MLGLIMAVAMVPGLLIGLQRTIAIDYDAVAYRTGAILAEDPGWPVFPAWEISNNKDGVDRLGLAVSKDSPNILSQSKIAKFNDSILFTYPEDYRQRIIFGDFPYRFNITLSDNSTKIFSIGDSIPESSGFGYIRRVVKIKGSANNTLNLTGNEHEINVIGEIPSQNLIIRLNLSELVDRSINPAYQFDPRIEPINIFIRNFSSTLNNSNKDNGNFIYNDNLLAANDTKWNATTGHAAPTNATLSRIRFYKNENPSALPFDYDNYNNESYILQIAGEDGKFSEYSTLSPNMTIFNDTFLRIYPGALPIDESTILDIRFTFTSLNWTSGNYDDPPHTLITGTHTFNYTTTGLEIPDLKPGWLEVAIW